MSKTRRSQLLTDEAVQGELLFRAIIYWFFCLLVVALLVVGWSFFSGPPRPLPVVIRQSLLAAAPAIFSSVILLPVVLLDVLKVSSRFVGPIQQIRHTMRQLATGQRARPVLLRKDDFWQDLAEYTNKVLIRMSEDAADDEADVFDEEFAENLSCTDSSGRADAVQSF
jgi:hypothetical protein